MINIGLKTKVFLAIAVAAATVGGVFYFYYHDSQERIATLNENNAKLQTAVATSEKTIKSLQEDYSKINNELTRINEEFAAIRKQNRLLIDKLSEHDLGYLAFAKPGLVEKIINNASEKAARCFEILTGADLTAKEKEAKSAKEFNSECPWLWPGNNFN